MASKIKVYAYANCDTCRKALKFLAAHQIEPEVIPIREQPPSVAEFRAMLGHVGGDLRRLFNTSGRDYKEQNLKDELPKMTPEQAFTLLAKNGNLVKRPFLITPESGTTGFKEEEWKSLLKI